jgi:hypothetical protein
MQMGFYLEQFPLPKPTPVRPPPQVGLTAPSGQMVMTPEQSLPLSVVPSTLVQSQNNAYGIVSPMYSTIAHTSPPIPNVAPSYGVPNDVFTDMHRIPNPNQPPVHNLRTAAMQSQLAARNELAQFKEAIANMMKISSVLIWVILDFIKNHIEPILIMWLFPRVGVCPILLNSVVMTTVQPGNILANILLN